MTELSQTGDDLLRDLENILNVVQGMLQDPEEAKRFALQYPDFWATAQFEHPTDELEIQIAYRGWGYDLTLDNEDSYDPEEPRDPADRIAIFEG